MTVEAIYIFGFVTVTMKTREKDTIVFFFWIGIVLASGDVISTDCICRFVVSSTVR
jgi:hypothetical protein